MGERGGFPLAAAVFERMLRLQDDVENAGHWPEGAVKFAFPQLNGVGFFPAAKGVYVGEGETMKDIPVGGVMALGHDWGTVQNYKDCLHNGAENINGNRTWGGMMNFFGDRDLDVDLRNIYFTNFFMGLRVGPLSVGEFPWNGFPSAKNNQPYVDACRELVRMQIITQKPKVLIVYGSHLPRLMAPLLVDQERKQKKGQEDWKRFNGFNALDKSGNQLIADVKFEFNDESHTTTVVSLVHPCYRHLNARDRLWKNDHGQKFGGDAAEKAMMREAMRIAGERAA